MLKIIDAHTNNLKNINLIIDTNSITLFQGPSGSGKSSLAIDTLLQEGLRRFWEPLRSFIGGSALPHVECTAIEGLPPVIGMIQEREHKMGPYESFGSMSELWPFIRKIILQRGGHYCSQRNIMLIEYTPQSILETLELSKGDKIIVYAPQPQCTDEHFKALKQERLLQGFFSALIDGKEGDLSTVTQAPNSWSLRVDRIKWNPTKRTRLIEAIEMGLLAGSGTVTIHCQEERYLFNREPTSLSGSKLPSITTNLLNYRSPKGACPHCKGSGMQDLTPCLHCSGSRYNLVAQNIALDKFSIQDIMTQSVSFVIQNILNSCTEEEKKQLKKSLRLLQILELEHIPLCRSYDALSTGEKSRLRLYSLLRSKYDGVLFIIDEPSLGLDEDRIKKILPLLKSLSEGNNGLIVIDHHPLLEEIADSIVYFGPKSGVNGGNIVTKSSTKTADVHFSTSNIHFELHEHEFARHSLNTIDGKSGSGKTRFLKRIATTNTDLFSNVVFIQSRSLSANPRSCVATYLHFWSHLRELYAQTAVSKMKGLTASNFSFNSPNGACGVCSGLGNIRIELPPLPPTNSTCPECNGLRFKSAVLQARYKGYNIAQILDLTIEEALNVLHKIPKAYAPLRAASQIGLGYLKLGQRINSLSGGESRRMLIAQELSQAYASKDLSNHLFLMDNPSAALHFSDRQHLLESLEILLYKKATVIVATHCKKIKELAFQVPLKQQ